MSKEVKGKIIKASKWSTLSEVLSKAITPFTYLLLTRILAPDDFGIATIPIVIIAFCQILWDQGFSKAVVQRQGIDDNVANVAFWCNLGLSILLYFFLFLFSKNFAVLFNSPDAFQVIRVQGLLVIVTSINAVYSSILLKHLDFRALFISRIIPAVITPLVSIPLALLEFGYWSLVFGTMAGVTVQFLILVMNSTWKPIFNFDTKVFRGALHFSTWSTFEGILSWFYLWFDSVIVGYYLSASDLGLYRTGSLMVNSLFAVVLSPIFPVLFATLTQYQFDSEMFYKIYRNATNIIVIIALFIGGLLFSSVDTIIPVFLNQQWRGIELVIMILGLSQSFSWLIASNTEAFRAKGKVKVVVLIMLVGTFYYLPTYVITSQAGLEKFLWARLVLVIVTIPLYLYYSEKILTISILRIFRDLKYVFLGMASMCAFIIFLKKPEMGLGTLVYNLSIISGGIILYILFLLPYKKYIFDLIQSTYKNKSNG